MTTDLTETGRTALLLGDSRYRRLSIDQSAGENGDRADVAILLILLGVSVAGEQRGEAGIRRRRNDDGHLLIRLGGGCINPPDAAGDLTSSEHDVKLEPVDGSEVGVVLPEGISKVKTPALIGLASTGVNAFKKSVYAIGGVIGVFMPSSCLICSITPESGLSVISEGKFAVLGVVRRGKAGLAMLRKRSCFPCRANDEEVAST